MRVLITEHEAEPGTTASAKTHAGRLDTLPNPTRLIEGHKTGVQSSDMYGDFNRYIRLFQEISRRTEHALRMGQPLRVNTERTLPRMHSPVVAHQ